MSNIKHKFSNATNKYDKSLKEQHELLKKLQQATTDVDNNKNIYVSEGLLYFTEERRTKLINKAESLCYSKEILNKLKYIKDEDWNSDSVDENIIRDLQAIEKFVNDHTPFIDKTFLNTIGRAVLQMNEDDKY